MAHHARCWRVVIDVGDAIDFVATGDLVSFFRSVDVEIAGDDGSLMLEFEETGCESEVVADGADRQGRSSAWCRLIARGWTDGVSAWWLTADWDTHGRHQEMRVRFDL